LLSDDDKRHCAHLTAHAQHAVIGTGRHITINFHRGISFPAIFSRALRLGIITEAVYKRLTIGYRARRLHLNEPGIYPADERPNRFVLLLYQALANEAITLNEAAYYMGKSVGEFREELQTLL